MKAPLNEQQDDQLVHQRYAYDIPHPKLQVSAPALFLAATAPQGSSKETEWYESLIGIGSRLPHEGYLTQQNMQYRNRRSQHAQALYCCYATKEAYNGSAFCAKRKGSIVQQEVAKSL